MEYVQVIEVLFTACLSGQQKRLYRTSVHSFKDELAVAFDLATSVEKLSCTFQMNSAAISLGRGITKSAVGIVQV